MRRWDNRGFNLPAVPEGTDEEGRQTGNDFTSDVRVRRAINLGIDRQEMIDHVLTVTEARLTVSATSFPGTVKLRK